MTPSREIIAELEEDLRRAPTGKVLYLEGRTDPALLLALVGHHVESVPREGWAHDGIWVRGLRASRGSGGSAVRRRIQVAHEQGYESIRGVIDGDGEDYETLLVAFSDPGRGHPHRWPTYCVENWLALVGWPQAWGAEPDWREVLEVYVPYAALNRVVEKTQRHLSSMGLEKYRHPASGPVHTADQIRERLGRLESSAMTPSAVVAAFDEEVERCHEAIARSVEHGHALINGKWLVEHYAASVTGKAHEHCRRAWAEHVAGRGGQAQVIGWWNRFVSS